MLTGIGLWLPVTWPGLGLEVSFVQAGPSPIPGALCPGPWAQRVERTEGQMPGVGTAARLEVGPVPQTLTPC